MSLSKPEAAPSAWCYVFTKFGNAGLARRLYAEKVRQVLSISMVRL
jgi:hypothetical protein